MPAARTNALPAETVSVGQCKEIKVLKGRPRADEGMVLLKRIATLVAPIMRKHGWTLPVLCEFFPDRPELLGMNRDMGAQIFIRLRPHHSPNSFYDLEVDLIGTMLHELTHNVHGPHNEPFYKFLDKLKQEYYDLRSTGYSGEGFLGKGDRVGKGVAISDRHLPMNQAKQKALEQAEKRAKLSAIMGTSGGQRLGGAKIDKSRNPREMMALAAERRLRDQTACKHGDAVDVQAEAEKAQAAAGPISTNIDADIELEALETLPPSREASLSQAKVIDLSSSDSEDAAPPTKYDLSATRSMGAISKASPASGKAYAKIQLPDRSTQIVSRSALGSWSCLTCTYDNPSPLGLQCEVCGASRDLHDADRWRCMTCSTSNEHKFWSCRACGTIKSSSSHRSQDLSSIPSATLH